MRQGSGFVISIFLARLLEPAEFGLVGIAMVFISISQIFIDIGFTSALIQNQNNTKLTYSSVFYLNIAAGICLTGLFYFAAPYIGLFFENNQITSLVRWLSLIFVFNSMNLVQGAILRKELNFKILAIRTFMATAIGGISGVIFAFLGYGVYSLVMQNIIAAITGTILLWSVTPWKPDLNFSFKEARKLSGFSSFVFFDQFISTIFNKLDVLIIGKVFSPATLGFYTRALSLNDLITRYSSTSLTKVFYPVLSTLKHDPLEFSRVYFKVISVIAFASYGIAGVLYIVGEDVIVLLFGSKWVTSIPIFRVLILAACNYPIGLMMVNAYMSQGKSRENFQIGIFRKAVRVVPLVVAYYYGLFSFTVAVVCVSYFLIVPDIHFLNKYVGLSSKKHIQKWIEGIIPLGLIVVSCHYLDLEFFWSRMIVVVVFVLLYLGYAYIIRIEGFLFILKNIQPLKVRLLNHLS